MITVTHQTAQYAGYFINHAAAKRILGATSVSKIWFMPNGTVGVSYRLEGKNCSTLISRKKFLIDAIAYRTAQVNQENYYVFHCDNEDHIVKFDSSQESHRVVGAECDCEDYQLQRIKGNGFCHPICKHMLATARHEGFSTFREYWANR